MKKTIYRLLLLTGSVIALFSCESFLEEKVYSSVAPSVVGDSEDAKEYWLNGIYATFHQGDFFRWGAFSKMNELDYDDITGPDWGMGETGAGNFQGFWASGCFWNGSYTLIHRANNALINIEAMSSLTKESKDDALGQCYFLRAFAYFLLVRAYGDCPIHLQPVSITGKTELPRSPLTDVWARVISDLKQAETLMYPMDAQGHKIGRPARGAARALLAKSYATIASAAMPAGSQIKVFGGPATIKDGDLTKRITSPVQHTYSKEQLTGYGSFDYKEYYRLACEKALEIITSEEFGLYDTWEELWKPDSRNKKEFIFALQALADDDDLQNNLAFEFFGQWDASSLCVLNGSYYGLRDHWYELFEDNKDDRVTIGVRHRWTDANKENYFYYPSKWSSKVTAEQEGFQKTDIYQENANFTAHLTKYLQTSSPAIEKADFNFPWLRYAEVLLLFAEADNEVNNGPTTDAYTYLNKVRTRSHASPAPDNMDVVDFRSYILEERRRELALEGNRRWDLIRWGIYLDVMNKIDVDENNVIKRRERKHLLFPIPDTEMSGNREITENNPGW